MRMAVFAHSVIQARRDAGDAAGHVVSHVGVVASARPIDETVQDCNMARIVKAPQRAMTSSKCASAVALFREYWSLADVAFGSRLDISLVYSII